MGEIKQDNILLIGYFGYINNQLDGQTIKTRLIEEMLNESFKNILIFDTQILKYKKIMLFNLIMKVLKSKKVIIMPGRNGLKLLFPIIFFISKVKNIDIYYIVIGGWLIEFLKKNYIITIFLKRITRIYIEIPTLNEILIKKGFKNSKILYNFRKIFLKENKKLKKEDKNKFKLVFVSRVIKEKGILFLIESLKKLKKEDIYLDIYGPITNELKKELLDIVQEIKTIQYKGVIYKEVSEVLQNYDLFVFPTFYEGEGHAGVIIESYIAGLPILASDWKYNKDFIIENKTGKLFETNNFDSFKKKLFEFYNNRELLTNMKEGIKEEVKKYSYNEIKEFLKNELL
ncbi:glycosyltransferase family 4 protein [Cetobacterium ceti]